MIIFSYLQHIESVKPAFVVQGVLEGEGALEHFRDHKHSKICADNEKNTVRQTDNAKVNYSAPTVILNGVFAVQIVVTAAAPYVT